MFIISMQFVLLCGCAYYARAVHSRDVPRVYASEFNIEIYNKVELVYGNPADVLRRFSRVIFVFRLSIWLCEFELQK